MTEILMTVTVVVLPVLLRQMEAPAVTRLIPIVLLLIPVTVQVLAMIIILRMLHPVMMDCTVTVMIPAVVEPALSMMEIPVRQARPAMKLPKAVNLPLLQQPQPYRVQGNVQK